MQNELITLKSNVSKYRLELHKPLATRYEVSIKKCTHVRIGISTINAKKYLPIGCTKQSYAYSSRGYKFSNAFREVYGEPYAKGDIIGVEIKNDNLTFYKNGRSMGVAFYGIGKECVYPGYSLYGDCELCVNYGEYQVFCSRASDKYFGVWE